MPLTISIIIPTKNRGPALESLLDSIKRLTALERLRPEVIIGDNDSRDDTWNILCHASKGFPVPLTPLKITKPGKSAVLNNTLGMATGKVLAFLDDDVVVDPNWLEAIESFFSYGVYPVGQGIIRIPAPDREDPEICALLQRYRTIPHLEFDDPIGDLHSLNGANIAMRREVFECVGGFNERLGPGASGTSEDVELARRILRAGIKIGYMRQAIVFHRVDRARLTEAYFKAIHKQQGRSRLLFNNQGAGRIFFNLCRVSAQYGLYSIFGNKRKQYRSKGRVYHYLGMLAAKWNGRAEG